MQQSLLGRVLNAGLLPLLTACGTTPVHEAATQQPTSTSGAEHDAPRSTMQVSGIMGTIPEHKVRATLEPLLPKFARCFARGAEDIEFIGGHMQFYFRVALDGRVQWVYPQDTDIGHRDTERCLLELAEGVRFPGPKGGGEAEVGWGFDMEASDGVRPPTELPSERIASLRANVEALVERCTLDGAQMLVTAYISPGGKLAAAGASANSQSAANQIDCVLQALENWTMPDPGSYAAKISFGVP